METNKHKMSATDGELERLLVSTQCTLERVAEHQALTRTMVNYEVTLSAVDPETKETLHGTTHITLSFEGALFGTWTQRKLPVDPDLLMKPFVLGRGRVLKLAGLVGLELGSSLRGARFPLQSRGMPGWDATELYVQSEHPQDERVPIVVHYDPDSRALIAVELTHRPHLMPGLLAQLRRSAVEMHYQRLLALPLHRRSTDRRFLHEDISPINIDS
jgi:hypothetical protein